MEIFSQGSSDLYSDVCEQATADERCTDKGFGEKCRISKGNLCIHTMNRVAEFAGNFFRGVV